VRATDQGKRRENMAEPTPRHWPHLSEPPSLSETYVRPLLDFESGPRQRLRQLGDVHRDAPGLVAGEQMRRRPSSERVAVGVADDKARVRLLDGPGRRKAALRQGG
jgi:hypothetical protein